MTCKYFSFIVFILTVLYLSGCFSGPPAGMPGDLVRSREDLAYQLSSNIPGIFGGAWIKHTVRLIPDFEDYTSAPGRGSGTSTLITATATLMDSPLINCGLKAFEQLSEMNQEDIVRYEAKYKEKNKTDSYHLVWLELRTSATESLLDLDKWNIFWETDQGQKYEPAEAIEFPLLDNSESGRQMPQRSLPQDSRLNPWKISTKRFLLFFPKKDLSGKDIIDEKTRTVTLVLFDWKHRGVKNKGTWNLQKLKDDEFDGVDDGF